MRRENAMAIVTAAVEQNGWVLAVTGQWTQSSFSDFALDPDGSPAVMLDVQSPGFTRSGEAVVPTMAQRRLVATKPLRQPYPNQALLDEVDHGDGTRTVRLALSNRVYANDVLGALRFAAGWRTGEAAATPTPTSLSTRVAPLPIVRAAVPFLQMISGPGQRLDLVIASHYPQHFGSALHQAVAAVTFTATDGTRTNTVWVTAPSTSTAYGDQLRCWGVDPVASGLFSGLSSGLITTHWTVYPWIGLARTSGSGHAAASFPAGNYNLNAEVPILCSFDPGRVIYPQRYIAVDAATGSSTPAATMVATTLAAARATPAATVTAALQAIYLFNQTTPAANGYASSSRSHAGIDVVLLAGVQTMGSTSVGTVTSAATRLKVVGDPSDPDPRTNCILRSMASVAAYNSNRMYWFENLTIEMGGTAILSGSSGIKVHFNNCELRGRPGMENYTTSFFNAPPPTGTDFLITATNSRWWKYGSGLNGVNMKAGLLRNFESSRQCNGIAIVTSSKISDPLLPVATHSYRFVDGAADLFLYQCSAYRNGGYLFDNGATGGAGSSSDPSYTLRLAVVNCIAERSENDETRFWVHGEGANSELRDCVFDGVTTVGQFINFHAEGSAGANLWHRGTIYKNCWIDRNATKHDVFTMDGTKTGSWEVLYGVGYEGSVNNNRIYTTASNFQYEFYGIGAKVYSNWSVEPWGSNSWTRYTNDLSPAGPAGTPGGMSKTPGGGDYRPAAGSPALQRGRISSIDLYLTGEVKPATPAAGALPPAQADPVAIDMGVDAARSVVDAVGAALQAIRPAANLRADSSAMAIDGFPVLEFLPQTNEACGLSEIALDAPRVLHVRPD
jgi:hypothetical protein